MYVHGGVAPCEAVFDPTIQPLVQLKRSSPALGQAPRRHKNLTTCHLGVENAAKIEFIANGNPVFANRWNCRLEIARVVDGAEPHLNDASLNFWAMHHTRSI